jgi:ketosteroid isomerase-like protein
MVTNYLLLTAALFTGSLVMAQKGIDPLIRAEKNFAAHSVAHGTKDAFLAYLDSAGIVFDKGKPVNGIQAWQQRASRPNLLNWWPDAAEIAASGDFGYTTGPWTLQPTPQDTIVARGRYSTVWHQTSQGEWKLLIDLGVSNTPASADTVVSKRKYQGQYTPGTPGSLVKAEEDFISILARSPKEATARYLTADAILNRNGTAPVKGENKPESFVAGTRYTLLGSGLASSGDLGYVYGETEIGGKPENYLRVWRREGKDWKIVLDVLRN